MIITVTLNPAVDKTMIIDNFQLGKVNRISNIRRDIGGKGVNVSKVLKNFNIDSAATGFIGGLWKKHFIDELNKAGVNSDFVKIKGNTRTNIKIVDNVNKVYTDVNEPGPYISQYEVNLFLNKFNNICKKDDIVILAGGVSSSLSNDIYAKLIDIAKSKDAITILDADGELLKEGIKAKPDIIKPNDHELMDLMNLEDNSEETLIKAAKELINGGIKKVLISRGSKGALYVTDTYIYKAKGLKVPVKSTVGAGDAMVAAIIYSIVNKFDEIKTLKYAVSSGTVSVTLEGTQACSLSEVQGMIDRIQIEKVEYQCIN